MFGRKKEEGKGPPPPVKGDWTDGRNRMPLFSRRRIVHFGDNSQDNGPQLSFAEDMAILIRRQMDPTDRGELNKAIEAAKHARSTQNGKALDRAYAQIKASSEALAKAGYKTLEALGNNNAVTKKELYEGLYQNALKQVRGE